MSAPARLTTIEALEAAIDMLNAIKGGKSWNVFEYVDQVAAFERARDGHRAAEREVESQRAAIREMSAARREAA